MTNITWERGNDGRLAATWPEDGHMPFAPDYLTARTEYVVIDTPSALARMEAAVAMLRRNAGNAARQAFRRCNPAPSSVDPAALDEVWRGVRAVLVLLVVCSGLLL